MDREIDHETALRELSSIATVMADPDGSIPEKYLVPWRGDRGDAFAVVTPTDLDQIRKLITFAIENNMHLVAQGERTGLVGSSVPRVQDKNTTIIVSMERYKSRLEYNASDRRVTVDAGYTLDEVNEYLKTFDVNVPIDVSSNPMVGGAVATNIGGSRVVRFGDARKLLLGVEVVLADNERTVYSTLTRARKDNSSANFTGVFCGSFGSFGIVTTAAFETYPILNSTYTAWMSLADKADLSSVLRDIEDASGDLLLACEFISKDAIDALNKLEGRTVGVPFSDKNCDVVFVEWGTTHDDFSLDAFAEKFLSDITINELVSDVQVVPSGTTWELRHRLSEAVKERGKLISCDVSVTRDHVSALRRGVVTALHKYDESLVLRDFGHLGDGGFHMNVLVEDESKAANWTDTQSKDVRRLVSEQATKRGGSFSAEHGLGTFNTELYKDLTPHSTKKISLAFKEMCDPHNVLGHAGIVWG